jgi:endogenous inhibitor of DNA gyrase (YacG/DUF329 family)
MNLKTDSQDAALEISRRNMHKHVKRVYDTPVSCSNCKKPSVVSNKAIGFCCKRCNKYNSVDEANKRYLDGDFEVQEGKSVEGFPAIRTSDGREYSKLRDEYEIRADLFANGKTRDSMGVQKFNRALKKELVKNKCYRGLDKTGV